MKSDSLSLIRKSTIIGSIVSLSLAHFSLGNGTVTLNSLHSIIAVLSLLPIIASAFWFGFPGGVVTSTVVALVFLIHILLGWPGRIVLTIHQASMIAAYLIVGVSAGAFVRLQEREGRKHWEAEILHPIGGTETIARIVLSHHERMDGEGYPLGLRGSDIPLDARILSVADVYTALRERRPYKESVPDKAAVIKKMEQGISGALDPAVIKALRELVISTPEGKEGCEIQQPSDGPQASWTRG